MRNYTFTLLFFGLLACGGLSTLGQEISGDNTPSKLESYIVDEFGRMGECQLSGRMDSFLTELQNRSDARGYIIFYAAVDTLPGNIDNFGYERALSNHIGFRRFDASRLTLVRGGFREVLHTELWIVPEGAAPPQPHDTIPAPVMPKDRTVLFDRSFLIHEGSEISEDDFLLEAVKQEREAEWTQTESEAEPEVESDSGPQRHAEEESPVSDEEEYIDPRTPKEIEDAKFAWIGDSISDYLQDNPTVSATIILYADDQMYDIGKLMQLIEQGRSRLAKSSNIAESSVTIVFGGYRDSPECEFWIIPQKGDQPKPAPADRPATESETTDN